MVKQFCCGCAGLSCSDARGRPRSRTTQTDEAFIGASELKFQRFVAPDSETAQRDAGEVRGFRSAPTALGCRRFTPPRNDIGSSPSPWSLATRLQVAMQHPLRWAAASPREICTAMFQHTRPRHGQWNAVQTLPAHVLRNQVGPALRYADAVDGNDVGVLEPAMARAPMRKRSRAVSLGLFWAMNFTATGRPRSVSRPDRPDPSRRGPGVRMSHTHRPARAWTTGREVRLIRVLRICW